MAFFAKNSMEESMAQIAKQMRIYNRIKLLEEIFLNDDEMSKDEYVEHLKELIKHT